MVCWGPGVDGSEVRVRESKKYSQVTFFLDIYNGSGRKVILGLSAFCLCL